MSCVEGAVVAQVPGPNQYWEHIKSKDRAYFIGRDPDGRMVWQVEGDTVEVGNLDWSDWRHIPGCTGWDWEPDQVEEYPQYWTTINNAVHKTAFVKRTDASSYEVVHKLGFVESLGTWETFDSTNRTRLTEQEALALLDKPDKRAGGAQNTIERIKRFDPASVPVQEPAETWPKYYINRDPGCKWYIRAENHRNIPNVYLPNGSTCTSQANWDDIDDSLSRGTWLEVTEAEARARIGDVPVAPEMDWVVQDRVPARNNVDEWCWCKRGSSPGHFYSGFGGWSGTIMHGHVDGDEVLHLRCRRKDLPVVEPEVDWVELPQNHVLRKGVDVVYLGAIEQWEVVDGLAGDMVSETSSKRARCLRKDVPKIESPEDWVTQDRVEARSGIDQAWWPYDDQTFDTGKWCWWPIAYSGSAIGRKHGHVHEDGQMLNLRCKRKDLPPVPAPAEETFPQWYILKESEIRSWVPRWAIKRTGEETAIRYAFDGGEELSAANETWYGGTDAWRKCNPAEAFERLGILVEEHLPAVPSDKRRVPVKLWVTYRLNDEGGDWPVRATQADQTCQNWKEIKFDGNGAFIEVAG